jgi:hypothetical protein
MMQSSPMMQTNTMATSVNTVASLTHDQIHVLQDQFQQQAAIATIVLEVEQVALAILQSLAPQNPQFQPVIATLTSVIPAQQASTQMLQNESNLLNELDDVQDQGLILSAMIQNDTTLVAVLQGIGAVQAANSVQSMIAQDQAALQALQPQIAAVEQQVSTFVH